MIIIATCSTISSYPVKKYVQKSQKKSLRNCSCCYLSITNVGLGGDVWPGHISFVMVEQ